MSGTGPADVIQLRGVRATGTHGVLDEERARSQPFEVDLDLYVDLRPAGLSDALSDTVDYGAVAAAVVSEIEGDHADLLEHLAERIARAAAAASPAENTAVVEAVTVTLRKLRPPVPVDMSVAAVRIHRGRAELTSGPLRPGPAGPGPAR